jgi:hypothetical protein
MSHTSNPSFLGDWHQKDQGSRTACAGKVCETPSQPQPGDCGAHLSPQATLEPEIGSIAVPHQASE